MEEKYYFSLARLFTYKKYHLTILSLFFRAQKAAALIPQLSL